MKTKNLDDAIVLATDLHRGQVDKEGQPYILHPIRVMLSMSTPKERMVAILHDVVEDCDITLDELRVMGFPKDVIGAMDAITHRKGEPYDDYMNRVCDNTLAIGVKRADISDNSSPIRLYKLPPETRIRLRKKYTKAINFIDSIERG